MVAYGSGYKVFRFFNTVLMILVIMFTLYPFLYLFALSLSELNAIMTGKVFLWPVGFNLSSYQLVLEHPSFLKGYLNTIVYTVCGTISALFFTIASAYPLSKKTLKGRKIFMTAVLITMFFSGGLIPFYMVVAKTLRLNNTMWAIILPNAWSAWNMIIMMTFFQGIPASLEESAALDGLNPIQVLIRIVLPLSTPVISTIALFAAVGTWNDWFGPMLFFKDDDKFPIMLFLRNIIAGNELASKDPNASHMGYLGVSTETLRCAAIIVVTLPIIFVYPFIQKYFVKGVMIGSIKG